MSMMTRAAIAERLAELKRTDVPRCSVERLAATMDPVGDWEALIAQEAARRALDAHLRHYAWFVDGEGGALCPGCATRGFFGWGIVHGAGSCSCGWPGRMYHFIPDPAPDDATLCRNCDQPRSAHELGRVEQAGETLIAGIRACPGQEDPEVWQLLFEPVDVARFTRLLWAHPYEVSLTS